MGNIWLITIVFHKNFLGTLHILEIKLLKETQLQGLSELLHRNFLSSASFLNDVITLARNIYLFLRLKFCDRIFLI